MSRIEDKQTIQWGYDLVKNAYLNRSKVIDEESELYLNYLAPFSNEFYGTHSPALLFGGHGYKELSSRGAICARDGIIPLTIFFIEMNPEELKFQIYIDKKLWFLVPPRWRKKVRFYEVVSDVEYSNSKKPKVIFLTGILNSTMIEPDEIDIKLENLKKSLGVNNFNDIEILAYIPDKRNDLWGAWEEENILNISSKIFKHLKLNISTPVWSELKALNNCKDYLYFELNSKVFIADTYLKNFALSRGAGLLQDRGFDFQDRFKITSSVRASLHHSVNFLEADFDSLDEYADPLESKFLKFQKTLLEFQTKNKKINFRWESWYASYIKNYYINIKQGKSFLEKIKI